MCLYPRFNYICCMAFLTKIKLSSVNNLSDARYAAAVGIDYIGFCFDHTHPQYIAPIKAKEMMDWITGSFLVAEFGNQSLESIIDISDVLGFEIIEVDNDLLPEQLTQLNKSIIKKIDVTLLSNELLKNVIQAYDGVCDSFHFYASQQLTPEELTNCISFIQDYKIIWGIPLDIHTLSNFVLQHHPYAIHLASGEEERAGIRDFDDLTCILETLTIEETE